MTFKITKFVHSCLLVDNGERVALFDPGVMSTPLIDLKKIDRLDDVFITHAHPDHYDAEFINQLVAKFPKAHITTTPEVVDKLASAGVKASTKPPEGVNFFDAPHESVKPLFPDTQEIGIHYLDSLSHPGDSHSFSETKPILALPVTGPWGSTVKAVNLALELKPKHILPIHDWHWSEQARQSSYANMKKFFDQNGIKFYGMVDGEAVEVDI